MIITEYRSALWCAYIVNKITFNCVSNGLLQGAALLQKLENVLGDNQIIHFLVVLRYYICYPQRNSSNN